MLNAVINNKSDFDVVIEEAKMYGELVLIVDEIHRMNKDKQDINRQPSSLTKALAILVFPIPGFPNKIMLNNFLFFTRL